MYFESFANVPVKRKMIDSRNFSNSNSLHVREFKNRDLDK